MRRKVSGKSKTKDDTLKKEEEIIAEEREPSGRWTQELLWQLDYQSSPCLKGCKTAMAPYK